MKSSLWSYSVISCPSEVTHRRGVALDLQAGDHLRQMTPGLGEAFEGGHVVAGERYQTSRLTAGAHHGAHIGPTAATRPPGRRRPTIASRAGRERRTSWVKQNRAGVRGCPRAPAAPRARPSRRSDVAPAGPLHPLAGRPACRRWGSTPTSRPEGPIAPRMAGESTPRSQPTSNDRVTRAGVRAARPPGRGRPRPSRLEVVAVA